MKFSNLRVAAIAAATCVVIASAFSQPSEAGNAKSFPKQPIKFVVPYPPGGGADSMVRVIASEMSKQLGTSVIVENKAGANTMIAAEYVAKQPSDGYTLLFADSGFTINAVLYPTRYDPIKDFEPLAMLTEIPIVITTNNESSYKNLNDVLDEARKRSDQVSFASYGQGSRAHLSGEMIGAEAKVKMLHVPFKGSSDALNSLLGKQVDIAITTIDSALPLINAGKLRALAIMSPERTPALPNVPTVAETVKGFQTVGWGVVVAPKGLSPVTQKILSDSINQAAQSPALFERYKMQGVEHRYRTPNDLEDMFKAEISKWKLAVQSSDIKMQ